MCRKNNSKKNNIASLSCDIDYHTWANAADSFKHDIEIQKEVCNILAPDTTSYKRLIHALIDELDTHEKDELAKELFKLHGNK